MTRLIDNARRHSPFKPELNHLRPAEVSVVMAGGQRSGTAVAELWSGSALVGLVQEQDGGVVVQLNAHAGGPIRLSATALERALAEARERLTWRPPPRDLTRDSDGRDRGETAQESSHVLH
jgi:hypothetical protein